MCVNTSCLAYLDIRYQWNCINWPLLACHSTFTYWWRNKIQYNRFHGKRFIFPSMKYRNAFGIYWKVYQQAHSAKHNEICARRCAFASSEQTRLHATYARKSHPATSNAFNFYDQFRWNCLCFSRKKFVYKAHIYQYSKIKRVWFPPRINEQQCQYQWAMAGVLAYSRWSC